MEKEEIILKSKEVFNRFTEYCLRVPEDLFFLQPAGKWSVAQNADHLVRSLRMTILAFALPRVLVRIAGGRANRPSRTYDELVAKYKLKLQEGGKASGRYLPHVRAGTRLEVMQSWQKMTSRYMWTLEKNWSDFQLDSYIVPHPLLGKITLRELCYFTIYHTEHHLNIIMSRSKVGKL